MIRIENLHKNFKENIVLNDIDLKVKPNNVTTIVGPNGSGKTTIIKCILGMLIPKRGKIYIDNINISYENTTGIESINNAIVSIYPNPTKNQLTINTSKLFSKVRIIDIMGKEVFTKNIDLTKNLVINTSNLENGYYSIQLLQGNRTVTHSFLKTN